MKKLPLILTSFLTLWAVSLLAAQSNDTSFVPRGMDLSVNEHLAPMGTAHECLDWDLSERQGALVKRDGYAVSRNVTGHYFRSLFSFVNREGKGRLIATVKAIDTNYQKVIITAENADLFSTTNQLSHWHRDANSFAVTYNNTFIIANGKNRPYYYNGAGFRPLVEVQPGGFDFVAEPPIANTNQVLDGRYYYAWRAGVPGSSGPINYPDYPDSMNLSDYSWQVKADSEWVRVLYVPHFGSTKQFNDTFPTYLKLYRTRAGKTPDDSFFLVGYGALQVGSNQSYSTFIDSIPDDSLGLELHVWGGFVDTVSRVADSTTDTLYKIGQPQWLQTTAHATDSFLGISATDSSFKQVLYRNYIYAWYDSSTSMISPAGPKLRILVDTNDHKDTAIDIITPYHDTLSKSYLWGILYRGDRVRDTVPTDSIVSNDYIDPLYDPAGRPPRTGSRPCPRGYELIEIDGHPVCRPKTKFIYGNDYIIDDAYYPIDTIKTFTGMCDTIHDTLPIRALRLREPFYGFDVLGQVNYPTVVDDRVFMASGSRVYFSYFDEGGSYIGRWLIANSFDVGVDDGDEITALHAGEGQLDIFKNKSRYWATEITVDKYKVNRVMPGIGCVAAYSIVDLPGGGFTILAEDGFYVFSSHWQSPYKTSGGNIGKVSGPIWPELKGISGAYKEDCFAWPTEDMNNVVFSFPDLDTSYVYSRITGQWCKWTFAPRMGVYYNTDESFLWLGIEPDTGFIFIRNDTTTTFRFGGGKLDVSDSVTASWKSLPMYMTRDYGKIVGYGLWKYSNSNNGIDFRLYDIQDTGVVRAVRDTTANRYKWNPINPKASQGWSIEIQSKADSLAIDRIDLRYEPRGQGPDR